MHEHRKHLYSDDVQTHCQPCSSSEPRADDGCDKLEEASRALRLSPDFCVLVAFKYAERNRLRKKPAKQRYWSRRFEQKQSDSKSN